MQKLVIIWLFHRYLLNNNKLKEKIIRLDLFQKIFKLFHELPKTKVDREKKLN